MSRIQSYQYLEGYAPLHPKAKVNGGVRLHILIAEKALGKYLPSGAVVHHFDENKRNNKNSNLVICQDEKYHRLLHVRQRVLNAGGDPNLHKICSTCRKIKEKYNFYKSSINSDGYQTNCIACAKEAAKNKYAQN